MVSNEVLGLMTDVSELRDRLNLVVLREMKRRGYKGSTEEELRNAVSEYRSGLVVSNATELDDLGAYMLKSLSAEAGESEGFEGVLMSYEVMRNLVVTDRMYVMSGRDVATDRVYVDYMLNTFTGKLSLEQAETLGVMLENYVRRVQEDAASRV